MRGGVFDSSARGGHLLVRASETPSTPFPVPRNLASLTHALHTNTRLSPSPHYHLDSPLTAVVRSPADLLTDRLFINDDASDLPDPNHGYSPALLAIFLCLADSGCEKESQAIVSIALHPTNANILYVATNDAVYKSRTGASCAERVPEFQSQARCDGLSPDRSCSIPAHASMPRHHGRCRLQEPGWRATLAPPQRRTQRTRILYQSILISSSD